MTNNYFIIKINYYGFLITVKYVKIIIFEFIIICNLFTFIDQDLLFIFFLDVYFIQ
jgi:hypothetical protein